MRFITLSNYHLIDDALFVCLQHELILDFCYSDLTLEAGGFELASTITLVLQANQLTKCTSHPKPGAYLNRVLNKLPILNMPGLRIWPGCERPLWNGGGCGTRALR